MGERWNYSKVRPHWLRLSPGSFVQPWSRVRIPTTNTILKHIKATYKLSGGYIAEPMALLAGSIPASVFQYGLLWRP